MVSAREKIEQGDKTMAKWLRGLWRKRHLSCVLEERGPPRKALVSESTFQAGRATSAKALRWELERQHWAKPFSCHWLQNQGTERGGDRPGATQLAEAGARDLWRRQSGAGTAARFVSAYPSQNLPGC